MRRLACCALFLAFACGDAPSSPEPLTVVANVVIDQSPGDSVPPVTVFPDSLAVAVTNSSGDPIGGALVNFQADPDGCVSPDVQSLQTNSDGRVFFHVTSGDKAVTSIGTCTVKTIRSRDGRADVADSLDVTILPGSLAFFHVQREGAQSLYRDGDTLYLKHFWRNAKDEWGNPIPRSDVMALSDDRVRWAVRDLGPSGTGWSFVVDTAEIKSQGYSISTHPVFCDGKTTGDENGTSREIRPKLDLTLDGAAGNQVEMFTVKLATECNTTG